MKKKAGAGASRGGSSFFPLMPWNWPENDPRVFARMKECGLTMAGFVRPGALDACRAAGLRAIVYDPRCAEYDWAKVSRAAAQARVKSLVAEVGSHPSLYGYYLRDEPNAELFKGLGTVARLLRGLDPGRWPYINLFPNYANETQLGTATYEEHLQKFVRICRPKILSYDNYFYMQSAEAHQALFWQNLEQVRAAGLRHGIPFWNIVLTVAHFHYREPTAADLRLQVFATLAYGGRGLSYFTYLAPQVGNYRAAPVDQFGNETPTWQCLQHVNLQVQKLAPTLLGLRSTRVYHLGYVPVGCQGPDEGSLLLDRCGGRCLVGELKGRAGALYLMLVNTHREESSYIDLPFRRTPRSVERISPYTGSPEPFAGEHMWLAPGQGVLLRVR